MKVGSKKAYEHPWKLMTLGASIIAVGLPLALAERSYLLAVVALIAFGVLGIQWLTVDPPNVSEEDVFGRRSLEPRGGEQPGE